MENFGSFSARLENVWKKTGSFLCVGLDPDPALFPAHLKGRSDAIFEFCQQIIDEVAPFVCAFKPQIAYFSAYRAEAELEALIQYIRQHYPEIPVILDAKRGDIGSTAVMYAREAFERYQADAVTVNPYMGFDSINPYLHYQEKGVIVLCRTSNLGSSEFQSLHIDGKNQSLYEVVAGKVVGDWDCYQKQLGLVVGATFPDEIKKVRQMVGDIPLLIPGIGVQGGDIAATVNAGMNSQGAGMLINSSRAILYASTDEDFAKIAAKVAQQTRDTINVYIESKRQAD